MNRRRALLIDDSPEHDVVAGAVGRSLHVLDAGCGAGRIARALRALGNTVDGIELSAQAAAVARPDLRQLVRGSITDSASWEALEHRPYDAIVFCHVLEHLADPTPVLVEAIRHITPTGKIIIVLPNVAAWRVRLQLLSGRWDYTEQGIMDRTHLKFYTWKTAHELITQAGLTVCSEKLLVSCPSGSNYRRGLVRLLRRTIPLAAVDAFLFVTEMTGKFHREGTPIDETK